MFVNILFFFFRCQRLHRSRENIISASRFLFPHASERKFDRVGLFSFLHFARLQNSHRAARRIQRLRRFFSAFLCSLSCPFFHFPLRLYPCRMCLLSRHQHGIALYVLDIPTPFRLLHDTFRRFSEVLHKITKRGPPCRIHVDVVLIANHLLVNIVRRHALGAVTSPQSVEIYSFKLFAEIFDDCPGILTEDSHHAEVGVGHHVAFHTILIAALFGAHLTVPSEPLEAFCLAPIGNVFWSSPFCFRHFV
mmetsp:Transcript_20646/g.46835  ORF Transcript_20646/g.46835 Transcript_20646/m.46835 type:complete len:249 (-) Transcript_20646:110-856(-)